MKYPVLCGLLVALSLVSPPVSAQGTDEYRIRSDEQDRSAWCSDNPVRGMQLGFTADGLRVAPTGVRDDEWTFGLRLVAWGRGPASLPVERGRGTAHGRRLEIRRGALTEWYVNDERGVEQGFTVLSPPAPAASEVAPLRLLLEFDGDFACEATPGARDVRFVAGDGGPSVAYTGLRAWDAAGRELEARFAPRGAQLAILVDDCDAVYPLTIDPWIWVLNTVLERPDELERDNYGGAIAMDGDTALVGAQYHDLNGGYEEGSVHVYVRAGTGWSEQAELWAEDASGYLQFGRAVSLDGDTALIGALQAAYVFVRSGTTWSQQAKLEVPVGSFEFGEAVAVSGDAALVGDTSATGLYSGAGAAYVFVRSGTQWGLQQKLQPDDLWSYTRFGWSLAIDGDTAVVGVPYYRNPQDDGGAAYVYERASSTWSLQQKLTLPGSDSSDDFGYAVDLEGDTAVISNPGDDTMGGGSGAAHVYVRVGTTWEQSAKLLTDDTQLWRGAARSIALEGNTVIFGSNRDEDMGHWAGSAYVFTRTDAGWDQETEIHPGNTYEFGRSVALSDNTAMIGAPFMGISGLVYVFDRRAQASASFRNDTAGTNPTGFIADPPVLGELWHATVDNTGTGHFLAGVLAYRNPLEVYVPLTGNYLLVDPLSPWGELLRLPPAYGYGVVSFAVPIPNALVLAGFEFSAQGGAIGGVGGTDLHNAYDLFVGYR